MAGTLYNANNVVVGHAVLWLAPWVASAIKAPMPDNTNLFDAAPWEAAGWVGAGATNEGFKVNVEQSTTTVMIEEQSTPVGETLEGKTLTIEAALAEATLESARLSWGANTITTVASAVGVTPKRSMTLANEIQYYTVTLETRNHLGFARRIYVPKTSVTGSGEVSFRRAADKQLFPVRLASLSAPNEIVITDITGVAGA